MCRVIRFHRLGEPESLQLEQIAVGSPASGEVRIKVAAFGLNRVEIMFRRGAFGTPALPSRIGYEAAGVIDAVGDQVEGYKVGDRVAILPGLSMSEYGAYTDTLLYPASMVIPQPPGLAFESAAAAWMQYLTAYALIGIASLRATDTVVITAASSSVGLAAIQIATLVGARSIAVTRGQSKAAALRRYGATDVVASEQEDPAAAIMRLTDGQGAHVVFDAVAGDLLARLAEATRADGRLIVYGSLAAETTPLLLPPFMLKGLTLHGYAMNGYLRDPLHRRQAIEFVLGGLTSGRLAPVIDRVFEMDDIVAAHRYLEGNTQIGKIVVRTGCFT